MLRFFTRSLTRLLAVAPRHPAVCRFTFDARAIRLFAAPPLTPTAPAPLAVSQPYICRLPSRSLRRFAFEAHRPRVSHCLTHSLCQGNSPSPRGLPSGSPRLPPRPSTKSEPRRHNELQPCLFPFPRINHNAIAIARLIMYNVRRMEVYRTTSGCLNRTAENPLLSWLGPPRQTQAAAQRPWKRSAYPVLGLNRRIG